MAGWAYISAHVCIAFEPGDDAKGGAEIGPNDDLPLIDQIAICVAGMEAQHFLATIRTRTQPGALGNPLFEDKP
jgi:hypothetical protein